MIAPTLRSPHRYRRWLTALVVLLGVSYPAVSQEDVLKSALKPLSESNTLKCHLERVQSVGGVSLRSTGDFCYSRRIGFRYDFRFGGSRYRFVLRGDTLCSVNLTSRIGFLVTRDDSSRFTSLRGSVHVLGTYLALADDVDAWKFKARVDQGYYFTRTHDACEQFIRISPVTGKVDLIEEFDLNGRLLKKIQPLFLPSNKGAGSVLPAALLIRNGAVESGRDSLEMTKVSVDVPIAEGDFGIPGNITWQTMPLTMIDTTEARPDRR
jgi:hypothetical protein